MEGDLDQSFVARGISGQALEFGYPNYLDCGNPSSLDFGTGNFTISAWVKNDIWGPDQVIDEAQFVISRGFVNSSTSWGWAFYFAHADYWHNSLRLGMGDGTSGTNCQLLVYRNLTRFQGEWFFITAKRDGDYARIYINGDFHHHCYTGHIGDVSTAGRTGDYIRVGKQAYTGSDRN